MTKRAPVRAALPFLLVLLGSAALRFTHLGYSHFQGDEITAQVPAGVALPDFLLSQKKGPGQLLITELVHRVTGRSDEALTRLPFALASLTMVVLTFALVRSQWGQRPGLLAAALIGTCGLLVGFGRIVQYQSFCMMFVLLAAWAAFGFARSGAPARLYLAGMAFGLGLLFHYDALTVGPTLVLLVAVGTWLHRERMRQLAVHLAATGAVVVALAGVFYVPYALRPGFAQVSEYLLWRVAAGRGMGTFAHAGELLSLYLPPLYLAMTGAFLLMGVLALVRRRDVASLALVFWFVSVFAFYMLLGGDPRSHVYNIFLPGLIIVGYGMWRAVELIPSVAWRLGYLAVWALIAAWGGVAWEMFVDHTIEHPWYRKTILGYPLPNLETRQIEGVFGFPYRRGLDTVGQLFDTGELAGTFDSNERDVMADFYFHSRRDSLPKYYIFVHQPLSLNRDLPPHVRQNYLPVREVAVNGRKTIDIYEAVR